MPEQYLPKADVASFTPDNDDRDFARAFAQLAQVVDSAANPEDLLLRLSTCRNVYMTVNTLFVALIKILGHGERPSRLATCCDLMVRGNFKKLRTLLDEISGILKVFSKKVDVWRDRVRLDSELATAIAALPTLNERFETEAMLNSVHTDVNGRGQIDKQFLALSTEEPSVLAEEIDYLKELQQRVVECIKVLLAVSELDIPSAPDGPTLFDDVESPTVNEARWKTLIGRLVECAGSFGFRADPASMEIDLRDADRNTKTFGESAPTANDARQCVACIAHQVMDLQERLHEQLLEHFRPNIADRPLPDLFKIDLTEVLPSEKVDLQSPRVTVIPLGGDRPESYTVALPGFGIPRDWYREDNYMRFKESKRADVESLLDCAISAAAKEGASAIILPEYAIPRRSEKQLANLARTHDIALIGGFEASTETVEDGALVVNEALIWLPEVNESYRHKYAQRKRTASVYEPTLAADGGFLLFKGTRLGTFAVLVCSDFRELDILTAYGRLGVPIDCLIVCSMNPRPEVFKQLAIADSQRFHSSVVVSNNCNDKGVTSADGSGVFWPKHESAGQEGVPTKTLELPLAEIGGASPCLVFHEMRICDLVWTDARPPKGFLPCPRCRRLSAK